MCSPAAARACSPGKGACARRSATSARSPPTCCIARRWACCSIAWCSPIRATCCRWPCTSTRTHRVPLHPQQPGARRSWRAVRSRSGSMPCTTSPARRAARTGTAASPTTTCIWTTRACGEGLVLIPHFQPTLVPGWLDKPLKRRHRASARLDNVVLLVPRPRMGGHAARRQAARPRRLQGLWRRCRCAHARLACRTGRERSGWPTSSSNSWLRPSVHADPLP